MSSPPRAWRALCPNCGAPVDFQSAASPMAVCSFCRSTLVRDGEALRRIGQSAELFDDHTPLQLGATGRYQGSGFALVGRLQLRYAQGTWNEWHALFDNGRSGWLSEDNGAYVLGFAGPPAADLPQPQDLIAGLTVAADGQTWQVASVTSVSVLAAEGELPSVPQLEGGWMVADLRNTQGEVATLEAGHHPSQDRQGRRPEAVSWTIGRAVALADLSLTGLKTESMAQVKGRAYACPSCGAALEPKLDSTKSLSCHQCKAVVDISQGLGADLAYFSQDNGLEPLIPLGRVGSLALGSGPPQSWQVVGYVEWCETAADPDDDQEFWREYLLYHRSAGFAFLVDANDGWSWSRPITGVPAGRGDRLAYKDATYRKLYSYSAKITYVLGEFYWQLRRDQVTRNTDYAGEGTHRKLRLYREEAGSEVVWSEGGIIDGMQVAAAFKITGAAARAFGRDSQPLGGLGKLSDKVGTVMLDRDSSGWWGDSLKQLLWVAAVVVVLLLLERCGSSDYCDDTRRTFGESSNEYRECQRSSGSGYHGSSGGSFGGWSSGGGGHK